MSSERDPDRPVISARGLSKCFEVYERPIDRLKQTLSRGRRCYYREFWALREVSFDLAPGESLGIIGRNGAGKSTLLQIVSGTMEPTAGEVQVEGRVAALLELGSGFNFDFTGRENVILNGILLGLDERTVLDRFDEIEAFADIGEFIDRPVQTYSTGMVMRLAFAVQVLLEPDILIVDEALAVGDVAFQLKCMNHMRRLLERGVSVILVAHDISAVRTFCDRVLWLENGRQEALGEPREVTNRYVTRLTGLDAGPDGPALHEEPPDDRQRVPPPPRSGVPSLVARTDLDRHGEGWASILGASVRGATGLHGEVLEHGEPMVVELEMRLNDACPERSLGAAFSIRNPRGLDIICYTTWEAEVPLPAREAGTSYCLSFELPNVLAPGEYVLTVAVEDVQGAERRYGEFIENAAILRVASARPIFSSVLPEVRADVRCLGAEPEASSA